MNAVDTNVFVYALDTKEPIKQVKAHSLLAQLSGNSSQTILLWQVASELLSCLRRWQSSGIVGSSDVEAHFRDALAMFPLHVPTAAVFNHSFDLCSQFRLSHWDSMVLAACKEAGVDTLYTEDLDAGTNYDGITIVNPFI